MNKQQTIRTPWSQRMDYWRRTVVPVVVWFLALGLVMSIFHQRGAQSQFLGWVRPVRHNITASTDGRLATILVDLYSPVERDQMLARLDDSLILAQINTAQAAVERLQAEVEAERTAQTLAQGEQTSQFQADLRRFQAEEMRHRLDAMGLRVAIEADKVLKQRLEIEKGRLEGLREIGASSEVEYDLSRLSLEEVNRRLSENELLLKETLEAQQTARQQQEVFMAGLPEPPEVDILLHPLREAIKEQEMLVEELKVQRRDLWLRAPAAGQLTQLACSEGQAVVAGEPIMVLTESRTNEVIAYARAEDGVAVRAQDPVRVRTFSRPNESIEARVVRVAESVELLPMELWRDPARPEYGRPFMIYLSGQTQWMPGEKVMVSLDSNRAL